MTSDALSVSLVIPVYNCERYLTEAIDSVLCQDYPNIELIVLDDGSTDRSRAIIEQYSESLFVRDFHTNIGQAATLNKGWKMARGDILSYLSADDTLLPGAISGAVEQIRANPDVILFYGDYELMDSRSNTKKHVAAPDFSYEELVRDIVVQPGPGVFFRRQCFDKLGGWDVALRQIPDYEYWLRLSSLGLILHVSATWARFRIHEKSQSFHAATIEKSDEVINVLQRYFEGPNLPQRIMSLRSKSIAMAYIISARFHLRAGRASFFWQRLCQAIRQHPLIAFRVRAFRLVLDAVRHRMLLRYL